MQVMWGMWAMSGSGETQNLEFSMKDYLISLPTLPCQSGAIFVAHSPSQGFKLTQELWGKVSLSTWSQ